MGLGNSRLSRTAVHFHPGWGMGSPRTSSARGGGVGFLSATPHGMQCRALDQRAHLRGAAHDSTCSERALPLHGRIEWTERRDFPPISGGAIVRPSTIGTGCSSARLSSILYVLVAVPLVRDLTYTRRQLVDTRLGRAVERSRMRWP